MTQTAKVETQTIATSSSALTTQILWISGFAALTAAAARFEIPTLPVPFTLQTMIVLLAGAFLGARKGAISQILYLASGSAGLPVFAGGGLGFWHLIGPTGGYLLAFPLAAALVGYLLRERRSLAVVVSAMAAGLLVIFSMGTLQLYATLLHDVRAAFSTGFLIFSWWDLLKLGAASMIYFEVAKRWPKVG